MISRKVALLAMLALLVLSIVTGSGGFGSRATVFAQSKDTSTQTSSSSDTPPQGQAIPAGVTIAQNAANSLEASPQYAQAVKVAENSAVFPTGYVLAGETPQCDSVEGCVIQVVFSDPQNANEISFTLTPTDSIESVVGPYPVFNFGDGSGAPSCGLNPGSPCGQPSFANLTAMGNAYAIMIEQTAQFKALANGTTYHVDNSSSFGYEWGPTIPSIETVTLFSPNRMAYITAYVYVSNSTIQSMSFANDSSLGIAFPGPMVGNPTSSSVSWPDMIALSLGVALIAAGLAVVLLVRRRSTSDGGLKHSARAGASSASSAQTVPFRERK